MAPRRGKGAGRTIAVLCILLPAFSGPVEPTARAQPAVRLAELSSAAETNNIPAPVRLDELVSIEAQRATIQSRVATLQAEQKDLAPGSANFDGLIRKIDLLQRTDGALAQWVSVLQETHDLEEMLGTETATLATLREQGPGDRTVSFVEYDAAADRIRLQEEHLRQTEDRYQLGVSEAEQARKMVREKESAYRLQKETADASLGKPGESVEAGQLVIAEMERTLATTIASMRTAELNMEKIRRQLIERQVEALRLVQGWSKDRVAFTEADLKEQLAVLDEIDRKLRVELEDAEAGMVQSDLRLQEVLRAVTSDHPSAEEQAHIDAVRQERRFRQRQSAVLNMRLERNVQGRQLWDRRYRLFGGDIPGGETHQWVLDARQIHDQLTRESRLERTRLDEMREENRRLEGLMESAESDAQLRRWREARRAWLTRHIHLAEDNLAGIDRTQRLALKLINEAEGESSGARVRAIANRVLDGFRTAWNFELAVVDERPVTVRKIVVALLMFVFGLRLSRWISRRLVAGLLKRTRIDSSGSAAVQSIIFYLLVIFIAVTALYLASIPLGLFALLGGALAIGIGFGSQNIINNFISGIILMLERPIRVGDMVEVEGTYGEVIKIGARCTQVRSGNNIDLMVPNSVFLESNVVNWTLSDDRFRCVVTVGVAYGSPTRLVEDVLEKAAMHPNRVQPYPPPKVIFKDFGDNSLVFEVHFWIRMKSQMERLSVESAVRFEIDERFRDTGITISFPQRDVHLDTLSPLQVRVVRDKQGSDVLEDSS